MWFTSYVLNVQLTLKVDHINFSVLCLKSTTKSFKNLKVISYNFRNFNNCHKFVVFKSKYIK